VLGLVLVREAGVEAWWSRGLAKCIPDMANATQCMRRIETGKGGVVVGVPAGKLSVSLLSSCCGSGLVGRTSHELEGHGHALLIVRHVCGISRGVVG